MSQSNTRVAFIGLGVMGDPMAGHLAGRGFHVTVFNRTGAKALAWQARHGGDVAPTPAAAARDADIVLTCVGNDADVRAVLLGADGALAALDAVDEATRSDSKFEGLPAGTRAVQLPDNSFNASSYFLTVFGRPDSSSSCECERSQDASLAQSLHLLNSKDVQDKLTGTNGCAAVLARDTQREDAIKVRELYNTVYSREPDAKELELALNYLGKQPPNKDGKTDSKPDKQQGYEDIIWALINTKEFLFNH